MTEGFQVVSAGLFSSEMGIDTHVSGSPRKALFFSVGYMLFCFWVSVLFGHSKINNVDVRGRTWMLRAVGCQDTWGGFSRGWFWDSSYEKVVWLDVSVDEISFVDGLYAGDL
jgi:hypothetical protein